MLIYIVGVFLITREEVINVIKTLRRFNAETNTIETKSAKMDFLKNVMILFLVLQINLAGLLSLV